LFLGRDVLVYVLHTAEKPLVSSAVWVSKIYANTIGETHIDPAELERIKTERNAFAIDQAELILTKEQNERLKKEIAYLNQRSFEWRTVPILRRVSSSQVSTFVIQGGTQEGIQEGYAVIVGEGMYVGKVTRVFAHESIVTASTDFELATAVSLLNTARTIGIAQGASGNLVALKFIPTDVDIRVNDLVVTSGLENYVPSGLLVGVVNTVELEKETPFQHAIVEPLIDIQRFDHVIILIPEV